MAVATFTVSAGGSCATGRVSWGGGQAARERVPWLPPANVPITTKDGLVNPVWWRFFHELAENRMGGINGQTVRQVASTVTQTQSDVADTIAYATAVASYAQGIAAQSEATAEVAQNAGLSGSGSIPDTGEPPPPPGGHSA